MPFLTHQRAPANENNQVTTENTIAAPSASTTHATPTLLVRPEINELILSIAVDKILHAVVHGEDEVEERVSARLQERGR